VFFKKSGGFTESLHFSKNQADLRNPCAFQKIRRIYRILAFFKKSGGFTESLRFSKNLADLQNPCVLQKNRRMIL
jgi:ribosomal protein L29